MREEGSGWEEEGRGKRNVKGRGMKVVEGLWEGEERGAPLGPILPHFNIQAWGGGRKNRLAISCFVVMAFAGIRTFS